MCGLISLSFNQATFQLDAETAYKIFVFYWAMPELLSDWRLYIAGTNFISPNQATRKHMPSKVFVTLAIVLVLTHEHVPPLMAQMIPSVTKDIEAHQGTVLGKTVK